MSNAVETLCSSCHNTVSDSANFCPQCGKKIKEPPLSTTVARQILIYCVSFFLAPFGLGYAFKYLKQRGYCINGTIPENCKCIVSDIGILGDVNSGVVGCINCAEQLTCSYCHSKTTALYKEDYCFRCSWRNIDSEGKPYRKDSYW